MDAHSKLLLDLPNTAGMRGELVAAIKRLAYERYTQLELGTEADFEQLWSEAFFADGIITVPLLPPN
jgi:hypothetical protein